MNEPWSRGQTTAVGATVGVVLLLVGAAVGRADVAVLAVPLVGAAVWGWLRTPSREIEVHLGASDDVDDETNAPAGEGAADLDGGEGATTAAADDEPGTLRSRVRITAPRGTAAVVVAVRRSNRSQDEVVVQVRGQRTLPLVVHTVRTGPQTVAEIDAIGIGPGGATVSEPVEPATDDALVLPTPGPLGQLPLPFRLRGLSGAHPSRRPGEGGGLRDVHPYTPGDRLRRIDWRVTARRSPTLQELYVRRELALAEAAVLLVVDSRDDIGPDPRTWRGSLRPRASDPTSLDLARQAATSLAQAYLAAGDRVGLDDLGAVRRPLPPGGGRRQLDRIRHALALTRPEGEPLHRVRAPQLPSGALVIVFSTFLDDAAADAAVQWRRAGHRVVAVDVLPTLREAVLRDRERLALRLVRLARTDRLAGLQDADVELVTWRDAPQVALAGLARSGQRRPGAGAGVR